MSGPVMCALLLLAGMNPLAGTPTRTLTFEDRVRAQEAIERVYYSHQIGATRSFEASVPRDLLERKVQTYLRQSVALQEYWNTTLTAEALRAEMQRIRRQSRLSDRLREIDEALGSDEFLVLECFARPSLVDRLARRFLSSDERIQGAAWAEARTLRQRLAEKETNIDAADPRRTVTESRSLPAGGPGTALQGHMPMVVEMGEIPQLEPDDYATLRAKAPKAVAEIGYVQDEGAAFVVRVVLDDRPQSARLATYIVRKQTWEEWWNRVQKDFDPARLRSIEFGGGSAAAMSSPPVAPMGFTPVPAGAGTTVSASPASLTCDADDTWDNGVLDDSLDIRRNHLAVWTGTQMIIWGGVTGSEFATSGHRYDPLTDSWTSMSSIGAPEVLNGQTAVWTGSEMIVWGGAPTHAYFTNVGARYDPVADVWRPTSAVDAPQPRGFHTATWTGVEMLVWGGVYDDFDSTTNTGGRYNPSSDSWTPMSGIGVPSPRSVHTAIWTGKELIVWGGSDGSPYLFGLGALNTGGRYDPATDSWAPVSVTGAPLERALHSAIWTGTEMIVWGGIAHIANCCSFDTEDGARYNPVTDSWAPMAVPTVLTARHLHTAVWDGTSMLIWGGAQQSRFNRNQEDPVPPPGARYDPASDSWRSVTDQMLLGPRSGHTAVWTGRVMIVWGGFDAYRGQTNTGGQYDPVTDSWTPTSGNDNPPGIIRPVAVWTGNEMIVMGLDAVNVPKFTAVGARYNPLLDAWTTISNLDSPSVWQSYSAVWSGHEVLVWSSDYTPPAEVFSTGARYDPVRDVWSSMSMDGAPPPRTEEKLFWTGREMLVWGGRTYNIPGYANDGGLYNPSTDSWRTMSLAGAPAAAHDFYGVWTGNEMLAWRGHSAGFFPLDPGDGGRYDPDTNEWRPMSLVQAPETRSAAVAVWTGAEMIIWGGSVSFFNGYNYGGEYDPSTDTWRALAGPGELSDRSYATAVWTGGRMVFWGGISQFNRAPLNAGAVYDPVSRDWAFTSLVGAPIERFRHTAVWTGEFMIVWGGVNQGSLYSGGRYAFGQMNDDDLDGRSECDGDCNDANASVYPGAAQLCGDRLNNDCLDPEWPSLRGTNEADNDGDSFSACQGDCNDGDALVHPGAAELPGNAADENCDGTLSCSPLVFYKTHGQFVSCVTHECGRLVVAGLVSQGQCDALVSNAAQSGVGRRQRQRTAPRPTAP